MLHTYLLILFLGLICVSLLTVIGSIASRKFEFNFSYLCPLSLMIYLGVSYYASLMIFPIAGITLAGLLGLFEATIGLKLILKLKAKIELAEEQRNLINEANFPPPNLVLGVVLVYMVIGFVGSLLP
ncbi:hypothetical protein [Aureispira anguillae]|uniref:Uncharacterized protein n=1 Tax=Aureispira anguillae TaxID=2864201 RepID=A0A915YLS7_9BACT|nr:hypothetical protein [Aureispira anguillae]BDS15458.1 hypothetical protein AsAng_0062420 [Aureispira anguillae]